MKVCCFFLNRRDACLVTHSFIQQTVICIDMLLIVTTESEKKYIHIHLNEPSPK